jgi:peptidoglycan/LPS O-acetylase OafA/YrhL
MFREGYFGVDLFFVLSGWLIGGQCLRGHLSIPEFWRRRWLRTLPSYFAVLLTAVAFGWLKISTLPTHLLFIQNYTQPRAWGTSWSLCVEEHFYLILPLILVLPWPRIRAVILVCAVLSPALLRALAFPHHDFYYATHARLDGLAIGVGCAALARTGAWDWCVRQRRSLAEIGGILIVAGRTMALPLPHMYSAIPVGCRYLVVSIGVGLALPLASTVSFAPRLTNWLARISDHSYAIYLVHLFIIERVGRMHLTSVQTVSASVLLTAGAAVLLRAGVERPFLALRDRTRVPDALGLGTTGLAKIMGGASRTRMA